jgi:hypothetical protein
MVLGSVLVSASQAPSTRAFDHSHAQSIAREVHQIVREALREARLEVQRTVRQVEHEVRRETRRAGREFRSRETRIARNTRHDARDGEREARAFRQISPTEDPCDRNRGGDRGHACEVRDTRLPAPSGPLTVDASPNGGIQVEGWDQADVLVRAVVQTYGETDGDARQMLPSVHINAAGGRVTADGPDRNSSARRSGWSVSFRIWAPRATALALAATNGGITVRSMRGESRFTTENGGVTLDDLSGQVVGTTRNGGVHVRLSGARWEGAGLDVETINGGVTLAVPASYSAALEVHTQNGGIRTDIPMTVQGRVDRELRTTLGSGGPLLKLRTVNGGVRINAR